MNTRNQKKLYPRGSEWRKWDLHLHCPDDVLNNQFEGKDNEGKWIRYIEKLENSDIEVVGLTNYFCINGYERIIDFKNKGRLKNIKLILPNIEFRLSEINKYGDFINFHIIFCDRIASTRIKLFLNRLYLLNTNREGKRLYCTEENLRTVGHDRALIGFDIFDEIAKDFTPLKDYLIVGVIQGYGSFRPSKNNKGRKKSLAIELDKTSHVIFGNKDNVEFFLQENRYEGAIKKPVVFSSDAHNLESIGTKFSWIKADPTFDGLKQIIYEPELRISLGVKPELYLYPQIISVQLKGIEQYQEQKDIDEFPPISLQEQIFFSPNLTTIIGPRASGKTVLVELLSYPLDKHLREVKKEEKLPLIPFLEKRFPNSMVTVSYQQGEQEPKTIDRKITALSDPFYTSPLNIEYWRQGQIEEVADKREKVNEYIKNRLSSPLLSSLSQGIDTLKEKLKTLRKKCFDKFETEIKRKNLLAERKQIEEYFEKLKTQEYKNLIKKIRDNRAENQLLDSFIQTIKKIIESLSESQKQIGFTDIPQINQVLKLFSGDSSLCQKINEFYKIIKTDFVKIIESFEILKESIEKSRQKQTLEKKELQLKNEFFEYCEKNGIKIAPAEYDKRTSRLSIINRDLKEVEAKLKEYVEAKQNHSKIVQELKDKLAQWKKKNDEIITEFNEMYSKSKIRVVWEDPTNRLSEWVKEQFVASDKATKSLIRNNYRIPSPAREDFVGEIIKELVVDEKYSPEKIIEFLQDKKTPPLEESGGKEENLKWFFQRQETGVLREDLIMRLREYGEEGNYLIQYKNKILGKDTMSFGERCGTVIELILYSGDHPLIIDQPEEHLDSKFIASRVVDIIREQKINRQIIVCTHNANIVVLGDSELITVLSVDQGGTHSSQGSLENSDIRKQIYDVLEGGPDAFRKREQKYGFK